MSESRLAEMAGSKAVGGWLVRLSIFLPLVFLVGVPTILITRVIFAHYYPQEFITSSPTISETASLPPASLFFLVMMNLVVGFIFLSWPLNAYRNQTRLRLLAAQGISVTGPSILQWAACILGLAAGFWLGTIATYNLEDYHDIHLMGSWAFYICQAASITLDMLFVLWMQRITGKTNSDDRLLSRTLVAIGVFIGSWFFLYMYLSKNHVAPESRYAVQLVYVAAEYIVATLFLAYPMTVYFELRRHLREFAVTGRMD